MPTGRACVPSGRRPRRHSPTAFSPRAGSCRTGECRPFLDGAVDTDLRRGGAVPQPADHRRLHRGALHRPGRHAHRRRRRARHADRGRGAALAASRRRRSPPPTGSSRTPPAGARRATASSPPMPPGSSVPASPRLKAAQGLQDHRPIGAALRHPGQGAGRGGIRHRPAAPRHALRRRESRARARRPAHRRRSGAGAEHAGRRARRPARSGRCRGRAQLLAGEPGSGSPRPGVLRRRQRCRHHAGPVRAARARARCQPGHADAQGRRRRGGAEGRPRRSHRCGELQRALPAPRGDGADQRHGAVQGRQAHGVGGRAGRAGQQGPAGRMVRAAGGRRDARRHAGGRLLRPPHGARRRPSGAGRAHRDGDGAAVRSR